MMQKHELRKIIRERKRQFSSDELAELSLRVISKLIEIPEFNRASTVMLYYSLPDEVDTHILIDWLCKPNDKQNDTIPAKNYIMPDDMLLPKNIVLPKVISDCDMELREYTSQDDLTVGSFGIKEPSGKLFTDYEKIDCAVIPGMAFDSHNNRLGRGKGYYDRFLAKLPPYIYIIGVSFDFQKFEEIPADTTDIRMDIVI